MKHETGSAITESLVGLLALVPAFLAVDYLGRLADMGRATVAAARYSAWETLTGEDRRSQQTAALEDRVFGNDQAPLIDVARVDRLGPSRNPLWADARGSLRAADADQAPPAPASALSRLPTPGRAVRSVAHGESLPSISRFVGLSDAMLDLEPARLRGDRIRLPAVARLAAGDTPSPVGLAAAGGLSPRLWQASTDRDYERRLQRIIASEPVDTLSKPAQVLGRFFIFKEARNAKATDFVPPSARFPRRRR